jgi:hypothetical protein
MTIMMNACTETEPQHAHMSAPPHMYWIYTEKGSLAHQTRTGAVVNGDPYLVPSEWVNNGLVALEALE